MYYIIVRNNHLEINYFCLPVIFFDAARYHKEQQSIETVDTCSCIPEVEKSTQIQD